MPKGDSSKYTKRGPRAGGTQSDRIADGEPAVLADGFDIWEWFSDGGNNVLLESLLDALGWPDYGSAGGGRTICCPNDAAHSNAGDESDQGCWAAEFYGKEEWAIITCQHSHCDGLTTPDMLALIGKQIEDGVLILPDEYESFSELLCDPAYFPDDIDGEPVDFHPSYYGVVEEIKIDWLATPAKVKRAFAKVERNKHAGDDHYAALYAGVEKAGNKVKAVERLAELMKKGPHDANTVKRLAKRGSEMLKAAQLAYAVEKEAERRREAEEAIETGTPANTSLDIAEPLGVTLSEALATLAHRYVLADVSGKYRVIRRPDLSALRDNGRTLNSILIAQTPEDFVKWHDDRLVEVVLASGDVIMVHPAREFLKTAKRKSNIVFEPDLERVGLNDFNIYAGRTLEPAQTGGLKIALFIWDVLCDRRSDLFRWLILWLAHMAQHPGEKPQSAVVVWGKGGCGKSTFGLILDRLTHPHCRTLDKSEHVVGRFAGEHLATTICAVCTEAAFAGDPQVARELKSLVTSIEIAAEPKGLPVMQMPSFLRLYFDSNSAHAVPVEGNGSERRYLVMRVAERWFVDLNDPDPACIDYWNDLYVVCLVTGRLQLGGKCQYDPGNVAGITVPFQLGQHRVCNQVVRVRALSSVLISQFQHPFAYHEIMASA